MACTQIYLILSVYRMSNDPQTPVSELNTLKVYFSADLNMCIHCNAFAMYEDLHLTQGYS